MSQPTPPGRPTAFRTRGPALAAALGACLALAADAAAQPRPPEGAPKGAPVQVGPVQPWPPAPLPRPQRPPRRSNPPPVAALLPLWLVILVALVNHQKQQQEEEEEVTPHTADPSTQFEYKIVRSGTGAFKTPATFRAMLEEEARAGWEMFEKLDHCRVRLRRSTAWRDRDGELAQDPYRTRYGAGEGKAVLIILLCVLVGIGLVAGIVALAMNR